MKTTFATLLAASASLASAIPMTGLTAEPINKRQSNDNCENTATSRGCWGNFSIDTNWYDTFPDTGVTREYWLSAENITMAPDGYERQVLAWNGTIPGPAIIADWGDDVIIHVTNNMQNNGTSVHWHGIRQLGSVEYDGVPGVTQCPIAPGSTYTYKFKATQYGSTWYHSHYITQYADGLLGPLVINGPATADYDEDLGMLFLSDWSHTPTSVLWDSARQGGPPSLEGGIINGTNNFDCSGSTDPKCVGGTKKFETVFEAGKKYRIRLVNTAVDGHFQFSIDNHTLTVIGNDLVPLVPFTTDSVTISMGQRYDLIVEANATSGDYWMRAGWIAACQSNQNPNNITGIIRYDNSSTADPTSTSSVTVGSNCGDEPIASLVPHLSLDVGGFNSSAVTTEDLSFVFSDYFKWTINSSSLLLNWTNPTVLRVFNNETLFPTSYNVVPVEITTENPTWGVFVIQDTSGIGITHPIHMHGHDFWVIAQDTGNFDLSTTSINLTNPPRRDVASLPGNGFLAIAFKKDNPGAWLLHCHIAWHASEGLAMEFVERQSEITAALPSTSVMTDACSLWDQYTQTEIYVQEDSGV